MDTSKLVPLAKKVESQISPLLARGCALVFRDQILKPDNVGLSYKLELINDHNFSLRLNMEKPPEKTAETKVINQLASFDFYFILSLNHNYLHIPVSLKRVAGEKTLLYRCQTLVKSPISLRNAGLTSQNIPRTIIQTSVSQIVTKTMSSLNQKLISENPEYQYLYFDHRDCRQFLEEHFDQPVIKANSELIPYEYQADIWKYAYLYQHGGVYLDLSVDLLKPLRDIVKPDDNLIVARDLNSPVCLVNEFLAASPKNPIFLFAIKEIVDKVASKWTSDPNSYHYLTGSGLLGEVVNKYLKRQHRHPFGPGEITNSKPLLRFNILDYRDGYIKLDNIAIGKIGYPNYYLEKRLLWGPDHYYFYQRGAVYEKIVTDVPCQLEATLENEAWDPLRPIPKQIYQTFLTNRVSITFHKTLNTWKSKNPEYQYYFYLPEDRISYLKYHFGQTITSTYEKLEEPDQINLWKYCLLYQRGGIYCDIASECLGSLTQLIKDQDSLILLRDQSCPALKTDVDQIDGTNLSNLFLAAKPKNTLILQLIIDLVKKTETNTVGQFKNMLEIWQGNTKDIRLLNLSNGSVIDGNRRVIYFNLPEFQGLIKNIYYRTLN